MASLVEYFKERDGVDPTSALDLLAVDVSYHLMPVPGVEIAGVGREKLRSILAGLVGKPGKHRVMTVSVCGGLEFVVGHRVQDDEVLGTFIAVASTNEDGALSSYVGAYFEDTVLLGGE